MLTTGQNMLSPSQCYRHFSSTQNKFSPTLFFHMQIYLVKKGYLMPFFQRRVSLGEISEAFISKALSVKDLFFITKIWELNSKF